MASSQPNVVRPPIDPRPWTVTFAAAVLVAWACWTRPTVAQTSAQTFQLRPRFVEGHRSRYEIWSLREQTQSVTVAGQSRDFETRFEIEGQVTWTVQSVSSNGKAVCVMTMDWITTRLEGPDGRTVQSDSRRAQGEPESMHQLMRAMTGMPVTVQVGADGSILAVRGVEAIRRRAPQDSDVPDELDFEESASDLATLCGAPPSIAAQDGWNVGFTWNHQLGKMHQSMRYTLQGVEEIEGIPIATVTGQAKLRLEPDQKRLAEAADRGWPVRVRLTGGLVHTQVLFDLQRFEAMGRNTIETRHVEMNIQAPNQPITRTIDEQIHTQVLRVGEE